MGFWEKHDWIFPPPPSPPFNGKGVGSRGEFYITVSPISFINQGGKKARVIHLSNHKVPIGKVERSDA